MCAGNILLFSLFLGSFLLSSFAMAELAWWRLEAMFDAPIVIWDGWPARLSLTLLLVVSVDLGFFVSHYLAHKVPFLWTFHEVHHSAEQLNPITAFRRHPVDLLIDGNVTGVLSGLTFGTFDYFSQGRLTMWTIAGVNACTFLFLMTAAHLQHSHVWVSYGRLLDCIFVSPAMHQIHHSRAPHHIDRNLGNIFSFWDALAGTLYLPKTREVLTFGLAGANQTPYRTVLELYWRPFAEVLLRRKGSHKISIGPHVSTESVSDAGNSTDRRDDLE
jgi:sterol desaturase/sphingolipid hydroxylase (fatty acid hydroxylase superfamily)